MLPTVCSTIELKKMLWFRDIILAMTVTVTITIDKMLWFIALGGKLNDLTPFSLAPTLVQTPRSLLGELGARNVRRMETLNRSPIMVDVWFYPPGSTENPVGGNAPGSPRPAVADEESDVEGPWNDAEGPWNDAVAAETSLPIEVREVGDGSGRTDWDLNFPPAPEPSLPIGVEDRSVQLRPDFDLNWPPAMEMESEGLEGLDEVEDRSVQLLQRADLDLNRQPAVEGLEGVDLNNFPPEIEIVFVQSPLEQPLGGIGIYCILQLIFSLNFLGPLLLAALYSLKYRVTKSKPAIGT